MSNHERFFTRRLRTVWENRRPCLWLPRPRRAETNVPGQDGVGLPRRYGRTGPVLLYNPNVTGLSEWLRSTPEAF